MNQGIHGIDLMQYFLGTPKKVFGVCRTLAHNIETEDTAAAVLEYENGAVGVIEGTTSVYPGYNRRFEICGTKGSIILEEDRIIHWDTDAPKPEALTHNCGKYGLSNPDNISLIGHSRQFEDMISAVRKNRPVANTPEDGAATVEIILAIYKSSKENRTIEF